jgi:solute carrier family 25 S-adenosylmethionine transporter 26
MEDVPDMAVKFAVYETMRITHASLNDNRQPSTLEDLVMGGAAGAAAAAATTPLDVIKTRMMVSASSRPTLVSATRSVLAEGGGMRAFFRGVGPRALSNGINSAVFFCFFEAIRRVSDCPQPGRRRVAMCQSLPACHASKCSTVLGMQ